MSASRGLGIAIATAVVASACASHTAPRGYLPDTREAQSTSYGGWIDVRFRGERGVERVLGELIAASSDSLWVRGTSGGNVVAVQDVVSGQLVGYDSKAAQVGGAAVVGVVSTISNGLFLVFTAPMWMIGGGIAAASQSRVPIEEVPAARWQDLAAFARFPQGMPQGVDLDELRPVRR